MLEEQEIRGVNQTFEYLLYVWAHPELFAPKYKEYHRKTFVLDDYVCDFLIGPSKEDTIVEVVFEDGTQVAGNLFKVFKLTQRELERVPKHVIAKRA